VYLIPVAETELMFWRFSKEDKRMNIDDLNEALEAYENDDHSKQHMFYYAATLLRDIYPDLLELVERRDIVNKAAEDIGSLATDVCMGIKNVGVDWQAHCANEWPEKSVEELDVAANTITKIAERIKSCGNQ